MTDPIPPERVDGLVINETTPDEDITIPNDISLMNMIYRLGRADLNEAEQLVDELDRPAKVDIVRRHRAMILGRSS